MDEQRRVDDATAARIEQKLDDLIVRLEPVFAFHDFYAAPIKAIGWAVAAFFSVLVYSTATGVYHWFATHFKP